MHTTCFNSSSSDLAWEDEWYNRSATIAPVDETSALFHICLSFHLLKLFKAQCCARFIFTHSTLCPYYKALCHHWLNSKVNLYFIIFCSEYSLLPPSGVVCCDVCWLQKVLVQLRLITGQLDINIIIFEMTHQITTEQGVKHCCTNA